MRVHPLLRRVLFATSFLIIVAILVPDIVAVCQQCRYSPNGWGFCRDVPGSSAYNSSYTVVVDLFDGTTGCEVSGSSRVGATFDSRIVPFGTDTRHRRLLR